MRLLSITFPCRLSCLILPPDVGLRSKSPPSLDREVGRRIEMRRLQRGISGTALADALDLSSQQVQKFEKGSNRFSSDCLQQIAHTRDVALTFFFPNPRRSRGSELPALLESAYALRMLKAFCRIHDRRVQKRTLALVKMIADGGD